MKRPEDQPISAVHRYFDAFNRGDANAMGAMCTDGMSILDGIAPYVWHGPAASQDWHKDALTEAGRMGARDFQATLGEPLHVDANGDGAYVVVPATMVFKLGAKQATQSAFFTAALRRLPAGWRLTSWAWTKGTLSVS